MAAHSLLTPAQAAERLWLSVAVINLIDGGQGPAYIKIRRNIRFLARDLDEWAEAIARACDDCKAEPGEECHPGCSSHWK